MKSFLKSTRLGSPTETADPHSETSSSYSNDFFKMERAFMEPTSIVSQRQDLAQMQRVSISCFEIKLNKTIG